MGGVGGVGGGGGVGEADLSKGYSNLKRKMLILNYAPSASLLR